MFNITGVRLDQDLQTTAHVPNPALEDISSGSRRHFVNKEKIIYLQKIYWFRRMYNPIT